LNDLLTGIKTARDPGDADPWCIATAKPRLKKHRPQDAPVFLYPFLPTRLSIRRFSARLPREKDVRGQEPPYGFLCQTALLRRTPIFFRFHASTRKRARRIPLAGILRDLPGG
jgi:hypothetical protein